MNHIVCIYFKRREARVHTQLTMSIGTAGDTLELRLADALDELADKPVVRVTDAPFQIAASRLSIDLYNYLVWRKPVAMGHPNSEYWLVLCEYDTLPTPWIVVTPVVSKPEFKLCTLKALLENHLSDDVIKPPGRLIGVYCLRQEVPMVLYATTTKQRAKRAKYIL